MLLRKTKTIERNDSAKYIGNLFILGKEHRIKNQVLQDIKALFVMTVVNPAKPETRLTMIALNQRVMMIDKRNCRLLDI